MDPSAFDTLARSVVQAGTRRRLLARLLVGVPLLGALAVGRENEAAAERPIDRLQQRTQQRNRKQRNNQNNNQNNNNGGGGGGGNNNKGGGGGGGNLGAPVPCGQLNQPCCAGNTCSASADLVCVFAVGAGGICLQCGAPQEPCCPGNTCSGGPNVICIPPICEQCGFPQQPCCAGNACNLGSCVGGMCQQ
jgi:hypothetical protein